MKRWIAVSLLFLFTAAVAFAGGQTDSGQGASGKVGINPPGTLPIVDEKVSLSCFVGMTGACDDFENALLTKWVEEKTNVHINWNVASQSDYTAKLNLIVASNDLPDMFLHAPWTLAQLQVLGTDEVLRPLNDLIDSRGVTSKVIYSRFPRLKKILTLPDGNIYGMPAITGAFHAQAQLKMWVYQPWMQALGIETPETTEDLYDMLMAFKTKDPNGNGKADEIPLAGAPGGWASAIDLYIMNSFIYNDGDRRMRAIDGKITVSYDKPEWREGLRYIKRLYDAGLIARESFTQTGDQLKQLGENPDTPILGTVPGGFQGVFSVVGGSSGRWLEYKTIPPVRGPGGIRTTAFIADMGLTDRITELCISTTNPHPEVAFSWGEFLYTKEATRFADGGLEGVNWEWLPENTTVKAVDGTPALFRALATTEKNVTWGNITPRYGYFPEYHSKQADNPERPLETILYAETKNNYMPYVPPAEQIIPILAFTEAASSEIADMETLLKDYVKEMIARFVTGDANLDTGWDGYLRELRNMGLPRYIELYQEAYDTTMN